PLHRGLPVRGLDPPRLRRRRVSRLPPRGAPLLRPRETLGRRSGRHGGVSISVAVRAASSMLFATRHRGLREQLRRLARAVDSANTVLLLGAPGTGKDRLARLLHERSSRAGAPFVRVDLAAVADDLFESELFGHERGAFTGAVAGKPGLLEGAGEGTLLRVVEERLVRRVGGTRLLPLKARLVASAGPDLPRRARAGTFREDLFYRLPAVPGSPSALSARREDLFSAARAPAH